MSKKEIIEHPLSDAEIKKYLPSARIVMYNELPEYQTIEQLLPRDKSYFIILFQDSENSGHWCCVLRQKNRIEFFDPYGLYPDKELNWVDHGVRESLGIDGKYLSKLFDQTPLEVVYNTEDYQAEKKGVNTCGRHVIFRLNKINMPILQYHEFFKAETKKLKTNYDGVVAHYIDIME